MTAIPMLYAETTGDVTDTGGAPWTAAASITTGAAWVAGKEYLIFASALIEGDGSAFEHHVRLVHGTTPTEFTDGDCVFDPVAANGGFWAFFMYRFTQPGTPEAVTLEVQGESTATITALMSQICAIQLTDYLTENTDFYWNEVTADYTTTSSFANQAAVTFTPNGTDDWLIIAHAVQIQASGQTSNVEMQINDSVGGTNTPFLAMEGEDPDAGDEARHVGLVRMFAAPSAASRTYALQIRHTAAETFTIASSRILALKLNKFDQHINQYTDGVQSPATSPTWTTLATASVTPNLTGNWFYIAAGNGDMDATTAELNIRLQDNNSGSYVSDPDYGDNGINPPAWNANNEIPHGLFKMKSLTSGASRTIRFEATRVVGSPNVKNATLVGFSAELYVAPQLGYAISDVSDGTWTTDAGGSSLFAAIDETSPSDADYIQSAQSPTADVCEVQLTALTDPVSSTGHIVRYRYDKSPSSVPAINLTVRLRQGASTTIATWTHNNISSGFVLAEQTLSGAEADAISNYADLRLQFEATQV